MRASLLLPIVDTVTKKGRYAPAHERKEEGSIAMQAVLEYTKSALQPGTLLGPYRLIHFLKHGGMSTVYLGYHMRTRAHVALKVVDSSCVDLNMMYREREIMQALQHEHIVPCLDVGEDGRYHYLVMRMCKVGHSKTCSTEACSLWMKSVVSLNS